MIEMKDKTILCGEFPASVESHSKYIQCNEIAEFLPRVCPKTTFVREKIQPIPLHYLNHGMLNNP